MAEFLEVMKQKKRMCKKYTGGGICQSTDYNICPLKGHELCGKPITLMNIDKIQEGEEIIMRWAAENPVVYPTWYEWLTSIGAVTRKVKPDVAANLIETGLLDPIPTDIAQKLGIEPKGV